jgi:Fe-S oxidoreductase
MVRDGFLQPPLLGRLTSWRRLPPVARSPFRDRWPVRSGALPGPLGTILEGMTVAYFVQCLTDWIYPAMGEAICEILQSLGAAVVFPRGQHCCGLPAIDGGYPERARTMAKQTIRTLEASPADYIVTGGTSCAVAVLHHYPHLFSGEPEWQMRAQALAGRFMDLTTFLTTVARLPAGSLVSGGSEEAAYHYFCQSYNVLGFRDEPNMLLGRVCGLTMKPLGEADVCCGFGGSTSFTRPDVSRGILQRKLENVQAAGVRLLVTDNPGCIMHLRGGLAAEGSDVRVMHTAEVLAGQIRRLRSDRL